MSEIDFAEIEKAMAELVNKAQGNKRKQDLNKAAKQRSEVAKQIDTEHDQADIATKRIIAASKIIRSNPHPQPRAPIMPPQPGRVMDFMSPASSNAPTVVDTQGESTTVGDRPELSKTVGDLSNEYLINELSRSQDKAESIEPTDSIGNIEQNDKQSEELSPVPNPAPAPRPTPEYAHHQKVKKYKSHHNNALDHQRNLPPANSLQPEDLIGPDLASTSVLKPDLSSNTAASSSDDNQQKAGKVHKIYGQRLPKEYLKKDSVKEPPQKSKSKTTESSKRGATFYIVGLLLMASVAVWGFAAYLYFSS